MYGEELLKYSLPPAPTRGTGRAPGSGTLGMELHCNPQLPRGSPGGTLGCPTPPWGAWSLLGSLPGEHTGRGRAALLPSCPPFRSAPAPPAARPSPCPVAPVPPPPYPALGLRLTGVKAAGEGDAGPRRPREAVQFAPPTACKWPWGGPGREPAVPGRVPGECPAVGMASRWDEWVDAVLARRGSCSGAYQARDVWRMDAKGAGSVRSLSWRDRNQADNHMHRGHPLEGEQRQERGPVVATGPLGPEVKRLVAVLGHS